MNLVQSVSQQAVAAVYLLLFQSNVPGQGLLNSISQFIAGPFGKAITLIAIVLCGVSYMYGRQSDKPFSMYVSCAEALSHISCGHLTEITMS